MQDAKNERQSRENRDFVQIYSLGWKRLQSLMAANPQAARFYALLAEHIDTSGAVVATQDVLAELLGVSTKSIQRYSQQLEDQKALVRIPIQGGIYAYALNPEEVWRAYDAGKEYAVFNTRTLVKGKGPEAEMIKRKLQVMIREQRGEPELPFDDDE